MGGLTPICLIGDMWKAVGAENVKFMAHLGKFRALSVYIIYVKWAMGGLA